MNLIFLYDFNIKINFLVTEFDLGDIRPDILAIQLSRMRHYRRHARKHPVDFNRTFLFDRLRICFHSYFVQNNYLNCRKARFSEKHYLLFINSKTRHSKEK